MQILKLTGRDFKYYKYDKENRRKDGQNGWKIENFNRIGIYLGKKCRHSKTEMSKAKNLLDGFNLQRTGLVNKRQVNKK